MPDQERNQPVEEDPRHAMARRRMEAARAELAAKDAEKPRAQRRQPVKRAAGAPRLADLAPSIAPTTFVHLILLAAALTLAGLAVVWCYALLGFAFLAGRAIALPTGILVALALSYASGCYLGIVESTSHGHTTVDDALQGDWRDWFWSLPMSLGMAALAGVIGYALGLFAPDSLWTVMGIVMFIIYPILQLAALETGSPLTPISLPVLKSLGARVLAWLAFYAASGVIVITIVLLARAAWRDPPYTTVLIVAPIATVALFIYGWLLGQLARWIGADRSIGEEVS